MGCGSSKAVNVADAPTSRKIVVDEGSAAAQKGQDDLNRSDSGVDSVDGFITETTEKGELIAAEGITENADLSLEGKRFGSRKLSAVEDSDDDSLRAISAVSTRSAPAIVERPSSRGGMAFDINMEGSARAPRRLKKLRTSQKKKKELTMEELQAKLVAAEQRKQEYEKRIRDKMQQESGKIRTYSARKREQIGDGEKEAAKKSDEKTDKAQENREAHLKKLRDRLKAKEEHARKVRENKRAAAAQE